MLAGSAASVAASPHLSDPGCLAMCRGRWTFHWKSDWKADRRRSRAIKSRRLRAQMWPTWVDPDVAAGRTLLHVMSKRLYRVKEVARIAMVTVRALHHYDRIGLLVPSQRSRKGYRLYDEADLLRLQQIVVGRALGMSLEAIRRMLDDPSYDRRVALREQRQRLSDQLRDTERMIASIDSALAHIEQGDETMNPQTLFDGFDPASYEDEVVERWGKTDAYTTSRERTARYTDDDWRAIKAELNSILSDAAKALGEGEPADGSVMMAVAERHRDHIDRWFYPCTAAMHAQLASLYDGDPRFAANFDKHGEGLATYFAASVRANAAGGSSAQG